MNESGLDKQALDRAKTKIREASRLVALTGAGVSAESGVPTFRGAGGLWKKYRSEDLATPEAFQRDPKLVWEWYNWRRGLITEKSPNAGHYALAALEKSKEFTLITQNVDGLHSLAGSKNIFELHGSIWQVRCTKCHESRLDRAVPLPYPPLCPHCQGLLRPGVVWFGESLDQNLLDASIKAVDQAQIMLVIGTSALVQPAASLAWRAKSKGAFVIEINLERTSFSDQGDVAFHGPSGVILPALINDL